MRLTPNHYSFSSIFPPRLILIHLRKTDNENVTIQETAARTPTIKDLHQAFILVNASETVKGYRAPSAVSTDGPCTDPDHPQGYTRPMSPHSPPHPGTAVWQALLTHFKMRKATILHFFWVSKISQGSITVSFAPIRGYAWIATKPESPLSQVSDDKYKGNQNQNIWVVQHSFTFQQLKSIFCYMPPLHTAYIHFPHCIASLSRPFLHYNSPSIITDKYFST